ncbi:MAG: DUF3732 domain-containing protein [Phycisphaerae bacterium]|nr:DUF3732 domain-containing protein [Phycisphaerae bacterium]
MRFYLKNIVLWPRTDRRAPRVLRLADKKLNVITGASKTGKSAVIPIIDYCLGSERCAVPVSTIRDACSWFGVVVSTSEGEKLLARREPGDQQSTGDMFVLEGETVRIPDSIADKNTNVDAVKRMLDRLAGLSNLGFDPTQLEGGFKGRPSFRDLLAFTFQPQNIVANPDVLFFKADTMEHKEKLRTIFPYVLGAMTPELLAQRWEIDQLSSELRRKERELNAKQQASSQWRAELHNWVSEARDLGLIAEDVAVAGQTERELLNALERVTEKTSADMRLTETALDAAAIEASELEKEEGAVSLQLVEVKSRLENMTRLRSAVDGYTGAIKKQRDRLYLSRWLRDLASSQPASCPVCGGNLEQAQDELTSLCDALAGVEATARQLEPVPAVFDKELVQVRDQLRALTDNLKGIRLRRDAVVARSSRIRDEQWRRSAVDRFLGRVEQAVEVLKAPQGEFDFESEVVELRRRLEQLRAAAADGLARERQKAALQRVSVSMSRLLPRLDSERPNDPAELNIADLTIRVIGPSGRPDFLWEIGSGANWLSYHVAVMLALHDLFLSQKANPVPSFLVLDQPSQVYFPRKLAGRPIDNDDPALADEDVAAVSRVFEILAEAAKTVDGLQVLVLDHAGSEVWGEADDVNLVEEWRDGKALVPSDWIIR